MTTLKVTSKRQATFPKETCEALRVRPGDVIELERREENGETIWVLRPRAPRRRKWVRSLASHAKNASDYSMQAVRKHRGRSKAGRMTVGLDASVMLRLLTGEPPDQFRRAEAFLDDLIDRGHRPVISNLVAAKVYFALQHHFNVPKGEALAALMTVSTMARSSQPAPPPRFCDRRAWHQQIQGSWIV